MISSNNRYQWPCYRCALTLGNVHLMNAFIVLILDISTNDRSETSFAISTSIVSFLCGIFSLIASRRYDRTVVILLGIFATVTIGVSIALFIDNVIRINNNYQLSLIHASLISFALIEGNHN